MWLTAMSSRTQSWSVCFGARILYLLALCLLSLAYDVNILPEDAIGSVIFNASLGNNWRYTFHNRVKGQNRSDRLDFLSVHPSSGLVSLQHIPNGCYLPANVYIEARTQESINSKFTYIPLTINSQGKCFTNHRRKLSFSVPNTQYIGSHIQGQYSSCIAKNTKVLNLHHFIPSHLSQCVHTFSVSRRSEGGFSVDQHGVLWTTHGLCLDRHHRHLLVMLESHCAGKASTLQQMKIVLLGHHQMVSVGYPQVIRHTRLRRQTRNTPPRFPQSSYTKYVPEEENPGYIVDTITASDPDPGQAGILTYSLIADKDARSETMFTIGSSSGQITTNEKLDRETMPKHYFYIVAIDNGSPRRSASAYLTINVQDKNDHQPQFERDLYTKEISESISISSPVLTVRASDEDSGQNQVIHYSLLNPLSPNDAFRVDPKSGIITTRRQLDREKLEQYTLLVKAEDQGPVTERKTATATVRITLKDENDNRPQFSKKFYSFDVEEDIDVRSHPVIAEIKATDADAGMNGQVQYSITGGNSFGTFSIDAKSGQLSVMQPLDYERHQVYRLTVRAQDEGRPQRSNITSIVISVLDVNDNEPRFYTNLYPESVLEDVEVGYRIMKVQAFDADSGPNADLDYTIVEGPSNMPVKVEKKTGLVVTTAKLDRERDAKYRFIVEAKDHGSPPKSATATVELTIRDVNDNAPTFEPRVYEAIVSEEDPPSTPVVTVRAMDADSIENARIQYAITSGNIRGAFNIISQTGQGLISLGRQLNYKEQSRYILTVTATDSGGLSDTATVIVNVTDANTFPPQFIDAPYTYRVPENMPVGSSVFQVSAADHDVGENARITYTMAENEAFQINPSTGVITIRNQLDREKQAVYTLSVEATDHGKPRKSDTTDIEFTILDYNDNSPQFDKSSYSAEVMENDPVGHSVIGLTATDKDEKENGRVEYTFSGGDNGDGHFSLEKDGIVRIAKELDRETKAKYDLIAYAYDRGSPARSTSVVIHVRVKDINDEQPQFKSDPILLKIDENSPIGSTVGIIEAIDKDEGENALVTYSMEPGSDSDSFLLTFSKGQPAVLTTKTELDYEGGQRKYELRVNAESQHLFSEVTVIVEVQDINDNLPVMKDFVIVFNNFKHHFPAGPIGRIPAHDPDVNDHLMYRFISGNQAPFLHLDPDTGEVRLDPGLDSGEFSTEATLQASVTDGLNVVKATCHLSVRLVTDDMLFNSITVRLYGIDEKAFLSSLYNRFVSAVASVIPTVEENVVVFNVQDDTDVKSRILNVSFSVRQRVENSKDVFFQPQFLRERVYLQRTQLASISTLQVLPFDDNLCVSELCLNYEECMSILKFGNASSFITSETMLFRPIRPVNAFTCKCPVDFTGSETEYMCDVEVNFCHSSPCRNNGTCVQREQGYNCKCPKGFTGDRCEVDMIHSKQKNCPHNMCKKPGVCVPLIVGGFRCQKCPDSDLTSPRCQDCKELDNYTDLCELTTRSFTNGSFLTFPSLKRRHRFKIRLSFSSQQKDGLLLYNGRYNEKHDFVALELVDGQVQFSFSLGTNITSVKTQLEAPVNDGHWHQVTVDYFNRTVTLSVGKDCDTELELRYGMQLQNHSCAARVTEVLPVRCMDMTEVCHRFLDLTGPMQLGGLPKLPAQFQVENHYYTGCISHVYIDEKLLNLNDYVGIEGTSEGCAQQADFCKDKPCKNGGTCTSVWNSFQCDCREGHGGKDCTQKIDKPQRLSGSSNIMYANHGLTQISLPWYNGIAFRTRAASGLLMYIEAVETATQSSIHISIRLKDGYVHYFHEHVESMLDQVQVNDGDWHYLEARWMDRKLVLLLDYGRFEKEVPITNIVKDFQITEIMVGGRKRMIGNTAVVLDGFKGCVQDIRVGNYPGSVPKNPVSHDVVVGCEDTQTCTSAICPKQSECLQSWNSHKCECFKGYVGSTCSAVCNTWNPCAPGSECIPDTYDPRGYRCKCARNQYGQYCEKKYQQPCPAGWVGYPICGPCNCSVERGFDINCHGHPNNCTCKENYYLGTDDRGLPTCFPCNCYAIGSYGRTCDRHTGNCKCRPAVIGRKCDSCDSRFAEVTHRGCELLYDDCPRNFEAGMWWSRTAYGALAIQACPEGSVGQASRLCMEEKGWGKPDMFNCTSTAFIDLKIKHDQIKQGLYNISAGFRAKDLMRQLEEATRETESFHGTDVCVAEELVKNVLEYENHQTGWKLSHTQDRTFIQNLVRTVGRILDPRYKESWNIINQRSTGATGLMKALDEYSKTLAINVPHLFTEKFDTGHENLVLGIDKLNQENSTDTNFPRKLHSRTLFGRAPSISIPTQMKFKDEAVVSYVMYKTLGDVMPMEFDTYNIRSRSGVPVVVNSPVFTLNLMDGSTQVSSAPSEEDPFVFQLPLLESSGKSNARCVYWKTKEDGTGEWSTEGCELVSENREEVQCACTHLSTFTVLMDGAPAASRSQIVSVQVLTYTGLSVCLVFLIVTFFTLFIFKRLQSNSNSIHLSIIFVLFVAHLLYLVGIYRTEPTIVCKIIAIGLQYCYMAAFGWIFVDVLHLYRMLTEIRNINKGSMVFYYVLGYAIPGTIVSLAVGLKTDGYGNESFCWLSVRDILIVSFAGPICMAVGLIVIVFLMALCALRTAKKSDKELSYIKSNLGAAMVLLPLLGLGWVFGLLAVNEDVEWFYYFFAIFTALQGIFIFLSYVIFARKTRREIKRAYYLVQGKKDFEDSFTESRDSSRSALAYHHNNSSLDGGLNRMNIGISTTSTTSHSTSKSSGRPYHGGAYHATSSSASTSGGNIPSEAAYPPTAEVPPYGFSSPRSRYYSPKARGGEHEPLFSASKQEHRQCGDSDTESEASQGVVELASSHSSDEEEFTPYTPSWKGLGKNKPPDQRKKVQAVQPTPGPVHSTPSQGSPRCEVPIKPWQHTASDGEAISPHQVSLKEVRPSSAKTQQLSPVYHSPVFTSPTDVEPPERVDSLPSHHSSKDKIQIPVLTHNGSVTSDDHETTV